MALYRPTYNGTATPAAQRPISRPTYNQGYDPVEYHQQNAPSITRPGGSTYRPTPRAVQRVGGLGSRRPATNSGGLGSNLASSYQTAWDAANEANEQRYQDILSGRIELRDRNMDRINSIGDQQIKDANDYYSYRTGAESQALASRGMGATTARTSINNRIANERGDALNRIYDDLNRRRMDADASLSEGIYGFMERREDEGPDFNQLANLAGQLGEGGYTDGPQQNYSDYRSNKRLMNAQPQNTGRMQSNSRRRSTEGNIDPATINQMLRYRAEQQTNPVVDRNMRVGGYTPGRSISIYGDPISGPGFSAPPTSVPNYSNYRGRVYRQPQSPGRQVLAEGSTPTQGYRPTLAGTQQPGTSYLDQLKSKAAEEEAQRVAAERWPDGYTPEQYQEVLAYILGKIEYSS